MHRLFAPLALSLGLLGCAPSYSPDTYATNAVQQANKVDPGVIIGVRPVAISAAGTVGSVTGAAAGGVAGAQAAGGATGAFTAIGGTLLGGLAGLTAEHMIGDTNGFEYIVRKPNGDLVSVAQKNPKPLPIGQKVLVIAGPQARIVADYTVPQETSPKPAPPISFTPWPPVLPVPSPAAAVPPPVLPVPSPAAAVPPAAVSPPVPAAHP